MRAIGALPPSGRPMGKPSTISRASRAPACGLFPLPAAPRNRSWSTPMQPTFIRTEKHWRLCGTKRSGWPRFAGPVREFWPGPVVGGPNTMDLGFSPDGSKLAVSAAGTIWVLPFPSGEARKIYAARSGEALGGAKWFPDGRGLVVVEYHRGESGLARLDIGDGSHQTILSGTGTAMSSPAESRDGQRIVYYRGDAGWDVVDVRLADGAVHLVVGFGGTNLWPDWSPAGTHFLFSQLVAGRTEIVDQDASGAGFSQRLIENGSSQSRAGRRTGPDSRSSPMTGRSRSLCWQTRPAAAPYGWTMLRADYQPGRRTASGSRIVTDRERRTN